MHSNQSTSVAFFATDGAHVLAEDCDFICRGAGGGFTIAAVAKVGARMTLQRCAQAAGLARGDVHFVC
jgi:hypothetical protein